MKLQTRKRASLLVLLIVLLIGVFGSQSVSAGTGVRCTGLCAGHRMAPPPDQSGP
jgi:hypothetical protein